MGRCPVILEIFGNLRRLDVSVQINNTAEVLFAYPASGMGARGLATILWKFILQHFYRITGPTAPTNTALIWAKGLMGFAELALRYEAATKKLARENLDKDRPAPKASKFNQLIAPVERRSLRGTLQAGTGTLYQVRQIWPTRGRIILR
jgi:hypothetical protein